MAQWDNLASYIDDVLDLGKRAASQSYAPLVEWSRVPARASGSEFGPNTLEVLQFDDFLRNASPEALAISAKTPGRFIRKLNSANTEKANIYFPVMPGMSDNGLVRSAVSRSRSMSGKLKEDRLAELERTLSSVDPNLSGSERTDDITDAYVQARSPEFMGGQMARQTMEDRLAYDSRLPILYPGIENAGLRMARNARDTARMIGMRGQDKFAIDPQSYGYMTTPWLTGLLADQSAARLGGDFRSGLLSLALSTVREYPALTPARVLLYGERVPELNPDMVSSAVSWLRGNDIPVSGGTIAKRVEEMASGVKSNVEDYNIVTTNIKKQTQNAVENIRKSRQAIKEQNQLMKLLSPAEIKGLDYLSPEERGAFIMKALEERAKGLR